MFLSHPESWLHTSRYDHKWTNRLCIRGTTSHSSSWSYIWPKRYWCTRPVDQWISWKAHPWTSELIGGPCYPSYHEVDWNALSIDNLNHICIVTRCDLNEWLGHRRSFPSAKDIPSASRKKMEYPARGVGNLRIRLTNTVTQWDLKPCLILSSFLSGPHEQISPTGVPRISEYYPYDMNFIYSWPRNYP